jgi:hypothetical protein
MTFSYLNEPGASKDATFKSLFSIVVQYKLIARSSSGLLCSEILAKLLKSVVIMLSFTDSHGNETGAGGHDQRVTDVRHQWSGLIATIGN